MGKRFTIAKRRYLKVLAATKAELLRKHHLEKVSVSELCESHDMQPSLFYTWQKQLFTQAERAFEGASQPPRERELEQRIAQLEAKLARKDAVIAEISEEYVRLDKEVGEP